VTLLEALVALVILALSAVGYLDVFQGSARAVRGAAEWSHLVSLAEARMEGATLGDGLQAQEARRRADGSVNDAGYRQEVNVHRWRDGLNEVVVRITAPGGTTYELRRVVRERRP
jgi:type II secretory pathway pseudopilin PulG